MRRKRIKDEEWIQKNNEKMEQEKFEIAFINEDIGKGVFAKAPVEKGELVMEYRGLLSPADNDAPDATYVYFFQHQEKEYCIDATDNESIARYVNDIDYKTKPNCKVKKVIVNGIPRLVIFAIRDIAKGVELRYDYGCRDNPWRSLKINTLLFSTPATYLSNFE
ncbi:histone-lysine N-methyltransferase set-1-like [Ruditapes philippinarum]|uniref:histone-lysine N-methyltransferase set-1-like n=1 Tax=Ruditapes philippinarum TaxID=129788 RepID=UPI00295C0938|nr:histone-lysine N-methyltransferase set-1-like [Ruditapes philippinarum]